MEVVGTTVGSFVGRRSRARANPEPRTVGKLALRCAMIVRMLDSMGVVEMNPKSSSFVIPLTRNGAQAPAINSRRIAFMDETCCVGFMNFRGSGRSS